MTVRSNLSNFLKILSSYNSNVLLASLVVLLLVVLFVLLLHFYARFFWSHSAAALGRRRRRRRTVTTTRIIPLVPLGGSIDGVSAATSDDKGLDSSVISSIPLGNLCPSSVSRVMYCQKMSLSSSLQVCRVQSFVESLDELRAKNRDMNRSATPQNLPLPWSRSLCFSVAPKPSTVITQQWELFD